MEDVLRISAREVVDGRPFTDPTHIMADTNILRYLIDQTCHFLEMPENYTAKARPIVAYQPNREEWVYRIVVPKPEPLLEAEQLMFVGFLGQRLEHADVAVANEFDEILVSEIPEYPGLLSYTSMALFTGNFANLVVFREEADKEQWSRSKAHAQAVRKLAPDFYKSIRLYNGLLPGGLYDSAGLRLSRIKYFDYETTPMWRAIRELDNG